MSAAVLTAPAVPVVAAESPDADLVRLCTEGAALAMERDRIRATASDDEYAAIIARLDEMAPVIGALVPATEAGLQAKAAFVLRYAEAEVEGLTGDEEAGALRDLLRDALRPRRAEPVASPLSLEQAAQTPVGKIAARIHSMWRESLEYDIGGAKRAGNDDDAADEKQGQLQGKAIGLMFDATKLPAANLSDVVALLDIAAGELQCLAVACEADTSTKKRHKGIARVLYSTTRVVAAAAGVAEDDLLHSSPHVGAKLFPRVPLPELRTAEVPSPTVLPSQLAVIADQLEQANARLDQVSSEDADAETNTFFDTADVTEQPIRITADLIALARICRAVWARTGDSDCELRDDLAVQLHEAVIALAGQAAIPSADRELLALAEEVKAAEMAGQLSADDDDLDAATSRSVAAQKKMLEIAPMTVAGLKAYARAAIWDVGRDNDGEPHAADSWGADLLWELAVAILGGDEAKPFYARTIPSAPPAPAAPAASDTTSAPTFALIAAEALRVGRQIQAMESQGHDEPSSPFYTAYFGFSRAALSYEPASLAETMTLAAFIQEQAGVVETAALSETRSNEIGEAMGVALGNVVRGIHRFGGVPMSAADPALDYLSGCAGADA